MEEIAFGSSAGDEGNSLAEQQRRLFLAAQLFRHSSESTLVTELDGTVVDANNAFCQLSGCTCGQVIGRKVEEFLFLETQADSLAADSLRYLASKGSVSAHLSCRPDSDDKKQIFINVRPVFDEQDRRVNYAIACQWGGLSWGNAAEESTENLHNPVTGLPNEAGLLEHLGAYLKDFDWRTNRLALIVFDFNRYTHFIDAMGQENAELMLKQYVAANNNLFKRADYLAHIERDVFALVLTHRDEDGLKKFVEAFFNTANRELSIDGWVIYPSVNAGIAVLPSDAQDVQNLLKNADIALIDSKNQGAGCYSFYSQEMTRDSGDYLFFQQALREAIREEQFYVVYQPQVDSHRSRIVSCEALLRWRHPERGLIPPDEFIRHAEAAGFIGELGYFVLRKACLTAREWLDQGVEFNNISVNVSGRQLHDSHFLDQVMEILRESFLPPEKLLLEITESTVMQNFEVANQLIERLKNLNVRVSVDDFGTGYSSLSYLKDMNIDEIKIDRAFVANIAHSPSDQELLEVFTSIARIFNLDLVVEGVENQQQLDIVNRFGGQVVQGYFYFEPLEAQAFLAACQNAKIP